jgi:plastocyanin
MKPSPTPILFLLASLIVLLPGADALTTLEVAPWYPQGNDYVFICNASGSNATRFDWYYGDGSGLPNTSLDNTFHRYDQNGTYNVICAPSGGDAQSLAITVGTIANNTPEQNSTSQDTNIVGHIEVTDRHGLRVTLACEGINATDYHWYTGYDWFFGDSTASFIAQQTITHVYQTAGDYQVSCIGSNQATNATISVAPEPGVRDCHERLSVVRVNCTGTIINDTAYDLAYSRFITCTNGTDTITVQAYEKLGENLTRYYELFVQNSTADITVCVDGTCVNPHINAYATGEPIPQCRLQDFRAQIDILPGFPQDQAYAFQCRSPGINATSWSWAFDQNNWYDRLTRSGSRTLPNGTIVDNSDVLHEFATAKSYDVSCSATDGSRTASAMRTVYVTYQKEAEISLLPQGGLSYRLLCDPAGIGVTDEYRGTDWQISEGSNVISTQQTPDLTLNYTFPENANYTIGCTARSADDRYDPDYYTGNLTPCTSPDGCYFSTGQRTVSIPMENATITGLLFSDNAEYSSPLLNGWTLTGWQKLLAYTPDEATQGDKSILVGSGQAIHRLGGVPQFPVEMTAWVKAPLGGDYAGSTSAALTALSKGCGAVYLAKDGTISYVTPRCDKTIQSNVTVDGNWHLFSIKYQTNASVLVTMDGQTIYEGPVVETVPDAVILTGDYYRLMYVDDLKVTASAVLLDPIPSIDTGLIAYYPGEGNLNDVVGGHNAIVDIGPVGFASGKIGRAMVFTANNTNGSRAVARIPELHLAGSLSMSGWVYFTEGAGVITQWGQKLSVIRLPDGRIGVANYGPWGPGYSTSLVTTKEPVPANSWHFITIVRDTDTKIFLDGELQDRDATMAPGLDYLFIGSGNPGEGVDITAGMNGRLDEFAIWNRGLSEPEVEMLYNNGTGLAYPFGSRSLPVYNTCHAYVDDIPATCDGNITDDAVNSDSCRYITCERGSDFVQVKACNKPGVFTPQYYEVFKTFSSSSSPKLCIGNTCISDNGYARSENFPVCFGNGTPQLNGSNGTLPSNGSLMLSAMTATPPPGSPQNSTYDFLCTPVGVSTASDGFDWDFGDGIIISQFPGAVQHTYVNSGNYTASCMVPSGIDSFRASVNLSVIIPVLPPPPNVTVTLAPGPSVSLTIAPYYPQANNYVFSCRSNTTSSFNWDFGDGQTLYNTTVNDIYHTFTASGNYTVTCTASG